MNDRSDQTSPLAHREFHRILLIKPSSLGDLVHALPVLHGLRRRYPKAGIDWLAGSAFAPLIEGHPDLSEVVRFDRRRYGRMLRDPRIAVEFAAFCRDLHRRRYDLVVDLQGLFRSGLLALASGAPVRIGFAAARELAWVFYSHRIAPGKPNAHAVDRNYATARLLGFTDVPVSFDLAVTETERRRAGKILSGAGLADGKRFAAIMPGARWETKRWPEDRFAAVVDGLARQQGLPSVLLAGPDEADVCNRIEAACGQAVTNLAGTTSLRELVAVLERAVVVICHDSAPMHLAAALGRPLVCLLGPTNPSRTGPYSKSARILQADLPCVPCYLRRLSQCPHGHACMSSLEVENVLQATSAAVRSASTD
ncbi:MAG TPA: lipopolysaccharide heptosyltransferase II [Phycisphaerae bacterium]|nr:lipopolysaccharide heptosyltransferase II [Phycisphaerae bacterium]